MALYSYKSRDTTGKRVSGTLEAATKTEVIDKLQKMGYMTTDVREASGGVRLTPFFERFKGVKSDEMLLFYIQFSNMISAGITILMCLNTLAKQTENKRLRDAIGNVSRQVEGGSTLSQAFAGQGKLFTRLFVNMIKAGEASGNLDTVLMRYAGFFERQEDLKEKVKGALFYPLILLTAGIGVTVMIVTFVIPQFVDLYTKAGVPLPGVTLFVYKVGQSIKNYWYIFIAAVVLIVVAARRLAATPKGGLMADRLILRIPIVGSLYRKVAIARFSRTLATLLASGVSILESLDITHDIIGNAVLANVITSVRGYVEKGEKMAEPLRISEEFPPDVVQMVAIGEETGNIDGMLNKLADFYDMTVNYAVKKLTTIIEPVFLVIMGVMVGTIMASMLLPMFDMVKTISH